MATIREISGMLNRSKSDSRPTRKTALGPVEMAGPGCSTILVPVTPLIMVRAWIAVAMHLTG